MKIDYLQKAWRPITMLLFGFLLVCRWFGLTDAGIDVNLDMELISLIKIGLGGYIIGRSAEKVTDKVINRNSSG